MSEIEKMYRTAKVVPSHHYCNDCQYDMSAECPIRCPDNVAVYPPFTAEEQIAILQILIFNNKTFSIGRVYPHNVIQINNDKYVGKGETFGEALAEIINKLWADMPEEERQQVKGILE